jgi:dipeptidase E
MVDKHGRLRVLLGSGGVGTPEWKATYRTLVKDHFADCQSIVFVPFASHDHADYTNRMQGFIGQAGIRLVGLDSFEDQAIAISEADGIYVGGGNSFLLVSELHARGLLQPIMERVSEGIPYLGVSAGANVACPTMMTTNDMPIALPPSFESFGLVPFQINPHYYPGKILFRDGGGISEHFGETRSKRIEEYHRTVGTPVLGMGEGSYVQWDGSTGRLTGRATAFRVDREPLEMDDGTRFDGGLVSIDR